jgi:cytosine/adenosine deaminase-related metal-dependent hydrolase
MSEAQFVADEPIGLDLLQFNLKLLGRNQRRNVLVSTGSIDDKRRLLPAIRSLAEAGVSLFATSGTHQFLASEGIQTTLVHKISDRTEPNIRTLLTNGQFDLVINILVGDPDYDAASDSRLIRSLSIENDIPLLTDPDVVEMTVPKLLARATRTRAELWGPTPGAWDMRAEFFRLVSARGGFANYHAHLDKAYLISRENLRLGQVDMQRKWDLYRYLQENYTLEDLVARMSRGVEAMLAQGVRYLRTQVDASSVVGLLPIEAINIVKQRYQDQIQIQVAIQPIAGVLDPAHRACVEKAAAMADLMGGLPSRDRPTPERHLDIVMGIAKDLNIPLDIHVDQENNPDEHESELLIRKVQEHGLEGRVTAIHAISISAQEPSVQDRIAAAFRDLGIAVTVCPAAALSMKQLDKRALLHNSIAPVVRLREHGVTVRLGVDNIADLFMPLADGDMWFECRLLMEACRFYDLEAVADMACDKSGFVGSSRS